MADVSNDSISPILASNSSMESETETLRAELKVWEKAFAQAQGRKPGRADIKADAEIAQKYKTYNRLSGRAAPAPAPAASTPKAQRKRTWEDKENASPHKSPRRDMLDTPSARRSCVGPTPQKNGQVLGLFDLLSPASSRKATPSKRIDSTPSAKRTGPPVQTMTPAKSRASSSLPGSDTLASLFQTPTAVRTGPAGTPGTPAVLRRDAVSLFARPATSDGADASFSPVPVRRLPPKPAGRALSQILRGLREMEEERLDDELDALREMEAEGAGIALPKAPRNEAHAVEWPLGPDGVLVNELGEEVEDRDDGAEVSTRRKYKKKGQKRTTRNVAIGVSEKYAPEPEWKPGEDRQDPKTKGKAISAAAHANFRALKIKNKNSKAKRGGRFGRR